MTLQFQEDIHQYRWLEEPDIKLTSVSTLIGYYHEEFDEQKHSKRIAEKRKITQEEVLKEWEDKKVKSQIKGTLYHKKKEYEVLNRSGVFRHKEEAGFKQAFDITELKPGVYPELIVYHPEYDIVGTADLVIIYNDNTFDLFDHKGFPLDTEIPTTEGFKQMSEIQVGDTLFDGLGNLTKVKSKSQIHYNPCYRITFDTNESIICDKEHKWNVYIGIGTKREKEITLQTKDLFVQQSKRFKIKNTKVEYSKKDLPIDPYVLGCWLGDGTSSSGSITNMNPFLWQEINRRGYEIGLDISGGSSGKAETKTIYKLSKDLKKLNLLNNKHIPEIYLRSSYQQRLDLLRGLMDTDGSFNRTRRRCIMSTTKKWQADAICQLVFSLGGKATIMNSFKSGFGKTNIQAYDVWFILKDTPFLTRNEDYISVMKNVNFYRASYRYIKKIEIVETVPTMCIAVESPLKTYLVTRNYLPTHNTNAKLEFTGFPVYNPKSFKREPKKMFSPLQHLDDCNGIHYTIQLSAYAFMLEEAGYECRSLTLHHVIFDEDEQDILVIDYPLNYLKKEVKNMFQHFKSKHK